MKKFLSFVLICSLLLPFSSTALALASGDSFDYELQKDGTWKITRFHSGGFLFGGKVVDIPESYKDRTVTTIGYEAFSDIGWFEKVIIPDSVTIMESNPFARCKDLRIIEVSPKHPALAVKEGILYSKADKRLICCPWSSVDGKECVIPQGVRIIESYAFYDRYIESVVIPDSVVSIGKYAFSQCDYLQRLSIPKSVTSVGQCAFKGSNLKSIEIPGSITEIEAEVFSGWDRLKEIVIPEGVQSIGKGAFWNCNSLISITIPESVKTIGKEAFGKCSGLSSVTIPGGVENIEGGAFYDCFGLVTVDIQNGVKYIGEKAFESCNKLQSIVIPGSVESIGAQAFLSCTHLTDVDIQDGVVRIGDRAFDSCRDLCSIMIPGSVREVGDNPFLSCRDFSSVEVSPDNPVLYVEEGALFSKEDNRLIYYPTHAGKESYNIPQGTEIIGAYAFYWDSKLTKIDLPDSVKRIQHFAFAKCK